MQTFYHLASHASSSNGQVRGPASALKGYLERVGWQLNKQGELITAIGLKLHLENTPFPTIQNILYQDWMRELIPMTSSRKSLKGAPIPDRKLTTQVLNSIDPHAQRGILREIAQSYQLETQKAKWAADTDGSCKWCSQVDTKKHRHCLCPAMQSVYNQFPETIDTLKDLDEINCNLPVVYLPNFYDFHQHVHHQFLQVHITDAAEHLVALKQERGVMPIFFSDGSCDHPEAVSVSKASWAIIALVPDSISQLEEGIQVGKGIQQYHDQFVTVAVSACHGEQTINRAELQAAVTLQEAWDDTCLITDSSYVISCFDLVRSIETPEELAFRANSDLLYRLYKVNHNGWGRNNIMIKVQSHTWRNGEPTNERLGHSLGNELADEQAKRANKELDMSFYQSVQEDAKTTLTEVKLRRGHYRLLAELHARQTKMIDKTYEDLSISATACLSQAQKPIWAILGDHSTTIWIPHWCFLASQCLSWNGLDGGSCIGSHTVVANNFLASSAIRWGGLHGVNSVFLLCWTEVWPYLQEFHMVKKCSLICNWWNNRERAFIIRSNHSTGYVHCLIGDCRGISFVICREVR